MAKNTNKLKSLFSGINRTGEQLINSVLNNTNSSINSSESDLINPSLDEKVCCLVFLFSEWLNTPIFLYY